MGSNARRRSLVTLKQGSVIKINFNPQLGHEQAGFRPALVLSNTFFNERSNMIIVAPITNTNRAYPTHVSLNGFDTQTTGYVMCEQVKAVDLNARGYQFVEYAPVEVMDRVLEVAALLISKDSE